MIQFLTIISSINQTTNLRNKSVKISFCFSISLTTEGCVSIQLYLKIFTNFDLVLNFELWFNEMPFSNSVQVNNSTVHSQCNTFLLFWISFLKYIFGVGFGIISIKQTNCKMYMHYIVHFTIKPRAQ